MFLSVSVSIEHIDIRCHQFVGMWLLNTKTAKLHEFHDAKCLRYAILSHVWQEHEQSFQDVRAFRLNSDALAQVSPKIRACCKVASRDGFTWLWIDTCCIDKTSSSELSEAINSMYAWYAHSTICYAYLYDVDDREDPAKKPSSFRSSRWFTRGWTLQELIAPVYVTFLSATWHIVGTKHIYAKLVEEITGIDSEVLTFMRSLEHVSVARRMSWAAERRTTREEDRAYSLMGVFEVHMPTIYGEGQNAFLRLQEEILRRTPDQSLFAWGPSVACEQIVDLVSHEDVDPPEGVSRALLASSPADFRGCGGISPIPYEHLATMLNLRSPRLPEYRLTSYGIRGELPLAIFETPSSTGSGQRKVYLVVLACQNSEGSLAALFLRLQPDAVGRYFVGVLADEHPVTPTDHCPQSRYYRVGLLSSILIKTLSFLISQPLNETILHPFDHTDQVPHILSPSRRTNDESLNEKPSFAFFILHRTLLRLETIGLKLHKSMSQQGDNDGLLVEGGWTRDTHESQDVLFTTYDEDNPEHPHQVTTIGITITLLVTEGSGVNTETATSPPPFSFEVHRRVEHILGVQGFVHHTVFPMSPIVGEGPNPDAGAPCDRAYLPAQAPTTTLVFGDGACRVELDLRLWENCHRSPARLAYMLEVEVSGDLARVG